eukprot:9481687-Pyramimonas_sp.AAC.1
MLHRSLSVETGRIREDGLMKCGGDVHGNTACATGRVVMDNFSSSATGRSLHEAWHRLDPGRNAGKLLVGAVLTGLLLLGGGGLIG